MGLAIFFTVPGQPHGKGRPRAARRGGFITLYTDEKTRNYESLVGEHARAAMNGFAILATPVAVSINAFYEIPKSWSKKKKQQAMLGEIVPGKSDIDNIAKSVLDGAQSIVMTNDRNVCRLTIRKSFSYEPRVEVFVYEVLP